MPRYLVERTFTEGLHIPMNAEGATACLNIVELSAEVGVTWLHSYVTEDKGTAYCIYDGPDPESIRRAAIRTGLPIDSITRVKVLDPYFYL